MKTASDHISSHWKIQHVFILLVLALLCYWPLTLGIFSAKNDNIVHFLPVRFHISEALLNGHLPLWTPYMYLGYPLHGDMQSGAWNPVVWLLSVFGRYDVTSIHREILISIFISGLGMYRLLGIKNISPDLRLIGASVYLMCGYITDVAGSNLSFLWAAAYAPFALAYYYHLLTSPSLKYALKAALALSLLLVSAYPSFFISVVYILLAGFIVITARKLQQKNYAFLKKILISHFFLLVAFLGLSATAIFSYLHVLPFYQRGSGVSLADAFHNSFHPSCSISFLLPTVPVKNPASFSTDLISRNAYFNSLVLIFLLSYVGSRKTLLLNFILAGIVFFFLFSLGDYTPVRALSFKFLPLMDTFRHPSNSRLFVIIGAIVAGMFVFENFLERKQIPKYVQLISLLVLLPIAGLVFLSFPSARVGIKLDEVFSSGYGLRQSLKNFFDQLSKDDLVLLNGIPQIIFLSLFIFILRRKAIRISRLLLLFLFNSFLFAQMAIPFTLASKASPKITDALLKQYPKKFPIPDKNSGIGRNSEDALEHFELTGISGFYNKKINFTDLTFTPTYMKATENAFSDSIARKIILSNAYAYPVKKIFTASDSNTLHTIVTNEVSLLNWKMDTSASFDAKKIWNNGFVFSVSSKDSALFCLQQVYLPGWKCRIDGKETRLYKVNKAFMAVKVPGGNHQVQFVYQPQGSIGMLVVSILSAVTVILLLIKPRPENA